MTLALAILGLLTVLAPVFVPWLTRKFKEATPDEKLEERRDENNRIIAEADTDGLNRQLDDLINRVPKAKSGGDRREQEGRTPANGPDLHPGD